MFNKKIFLLSLTLLLSQTLTAKDNYLWLENIDGKESMNWVTLHNKITDDKLRGNKLYKELYTQALSVLNNKSRLPAITQNGKWLYNLWQDELHPRGVYRKTTLKQFKKDKPRWQTVLDMDKYSEKHGQNYDFHGMRCLPPKGVDCLVFLSPGGSDAIEVREFDLKKKKFIKDGFNVPLAKTQISWIDKNSVFIGTEFGKDSMTDSGYPRTVRIWKRNSPLSAAKIIYTADKTAMSTRAQRIDNDLQFDLLTDNTSFWLNNKYQIRDGEIIALAIPKSATISGIYHNKLVLSLKQDWQFNQQNFIQGEIVLVDISLLRGEPGTIESIIKPDGSTVIDGVNVTSQGLLITILEDVKAKLCRYQKQDDGQWLIQTIAFPDNGAISISSVDDETGDFFVQYESFITPPSLYYVNSKNLEAELIKQQAESFDGSQFKVQQFFTQSVDGTKVPYFVVMHKNIKFDGKNPTHIFSYGGFRNTLTPSYSGSYEALSGAYGKLWLERGGVFVLANIRGGGEYGPAWHQAALLKNRHKAFEDFEAVARDLFKRNITSAEHLGIEGRSNGGLLVTATMTRHPEYYGAVVCGAPLIDMQRYNKLLAGASWMGEYGNPDEAEMWEYIKTYSPYQNVDPSVKYPPIFFYTSTRDDRVHPGHARKMAAKMLDLGNSVDYFENIEGGHHGFSTNEQLAHRLALSYTHLWSHLK
ncbi:MAG TPA: S9 family peptidase [Oceanospirillales bacterium]|nr:S9 family peptidase [Oceanospirillales bacterium]